MGSNVWPMIASRPLGTTFHWIGTVPTQNSRSRAFAAAGAASRHSATSAPRETRAGDTGRASTARPDQSSPAADFVLEELLDAQYALHPGMDGAHEAQRGAGLGADLQ